MSFTRFSRSALIVAIPFLAVLIPEFRLLNSAGSGAVVAQAPADQQPTRMIFGISSADNLIAALEYIVATLAGKKTSWENNVYPNLEVFTSGVAMDQPIRFDQMFDPQEGRLTQAIIPVTVLKDFLDENLDPTGIIPKRDAKDKNLYELSGEVFEGALRYLPKPTPYAVIYSHAEQIPADMEPPETLHAELATQGLTFLQLNNTPQTTPARQAAFDHFRSKTLDGLQKASMESADQFALRKQLRMQSLAFLEQWFVESETLTLTTNVNPDQGDAPTALSVTPLPETSLASNIAQIGQMASKFAAVTAPEDAVFTLRVNSPIAPRQVEGYKQVYALARPVMLEKITQDESMTAEQKQARQLIAGSFLDLLTEGISLNRLDLFLDVIPSNGKHAVVGGVRCAGPEKIETIIEQIPVAKPGWTLTKNVDAVGDVKIHKLTGSGERPQSLIDFYGTDAVAYVGIGSDSFWLSAGADGLAVLKSRLQAVADGGTPQADGVAVSLKMHVRPVLMTTRDVFKVADLGLAKSMNVKDIRQEQNASGDSGAGKKRGSELAKFEWKETAIATLEGQDDRFEFQLKLTDNGGMSGLANAQKGVVKTLGTLIAKFADENLK